MTNPNPFLTRPRTQAVEDIDLSEGIITTLEPNVATFTTIRTLNLSSNKIAVLPVELAELWMLREINLSHNDAIAEWPDAVRQVRFPPF